MIRGLKIPGGNTDGRLILLPSSLTHTHKCLTALCPGQPRWAGTTRNIHPHTHILIIKHPLSTSAIYYDLQHPPCSVYVFGSPFTTSLQVLFGLPLHFFTQSLSSFHNTCPYHRNLPWLSSTQIMSSVPNLPLSSLLGNSAAGNKQDQYTTVVFQTGTQHRNRRKLQFSPVNGIKLNQR